VTKIKGLLCAKTNLYLLLQTCTSVLEALQSGEFGECEASVEDYRTGCHALFPHATVFASKTLNGIGGGPSGNGDVQSRDVLEETASSKEISDGMS